MRRHPKAKEASNAFVCEQCGHRSAWKAEHERHLLRLAATRVQMRVTETVWQAFWRTTMQAEAVPVVAEELGISVGKVYGARSRVLNMLQRTVAELNDDSDEDKES